MSTRNPFAPQRDTVRSRTPMRCPICHGRLQNVLVRDLGSAAPGLTWQIHAGECGDHGWFQTEVISRPPREIFAVTKPFGAARRVVVNGREYYSFSTVWNDLSGDERRQKIDPLDATYWETHAIAEG